MKKISTEEFIKRCTIIHKGKYDYSKTIYCGNKEPVLIICPIHGEFTLTRAGRHLEGCGCPTCGKIAGGKSKILKYFERMYSPKIIISYCEKNKFTGNSYIKCGFKLKEESEPSYCYYKNGRKIHKNDYKKEKINFDEDLSEWENMSNNGYMRLFDYGNYVFIKEH